MDGVTDLLLGFGTMMTLIVAIGAQNAFVLRQGLRREAVAKVVLVCALSDAILVAVGVAGFGTIVKMWPAADHGRGRRRRAFPAGLRISGRTPGVPPGRDDRRHGGRAPGRCSRRSR